MENIGIWLVAIAAWTLFIVSLLIPSIDWTPIIFLVLSILVFALVVDWLISDTKTKKKRQKPSGQKADLSRSE